MSRLKLLIPEKALCALFVVAAIFLLAIGKRDLLAQETAATPSVLHIQHSVTTSQTGFPQFIYMYHPVVGADSGVEALAISGTISLANQSRELQRVLWLIAYWAGPCPANDQSLDGASFIWSVILKNPTQSDSKFPVNVRFPSRCLFSDA